MAKCYASFRQFQPLGKDLEDELSSACANYFKAIGEENSIEYTTGTSSDILQGTDIKIWGVPCDFTCNIENKDHTDVLPISVPLLSGVVVKFGVRYGNSHHGFTRFDEPVLVIGIAGADERFLGTWMTNIVDSFSKKLSEIIETGQSQYWDWCDAH